MRDRKRLKRILDVKRKLRDRSVAELHRANDALNHAERRAEEAQQVVTGAVRDLTAAGTGDELRRSAHIVSRAADDRQTADQRVVDRTLLVDERRRERHGAEREVRTLETLDDRLAEAETQEQRRVEQKETDEIASQRRKR